MEKQRQMIDAMERVRGANPTDVAVDHEVRLRRLEAAVNWARVFGGGLLVTWWHLAQNGWRM
jgi:hypothetical protein